MCADPRSQMYLAPRDCAGRPARRPVPEMPQTRRSSATWRATHASKRRSVAHVIARSRPAGISPSAGEYHLGRVDPGKGAYFVPGDALTLQSKPREGGINPPQVPAGFHFPRQIEMMERAANGLHHVEMAGRIEDLIGHDYDDSTTAQGAFQQGREQCEPRWPSHRIVRFEHRSLRTSAEFRIAWGGTQLD